MHRIMVIVPITTAIFDEEVRKEFTAYAAAGTTVDVAHLDRGPASIESHYDEALATPDVLVKVKQSEERGYGGVVVDCFGDPGVRAAREIVRIPVLGAGSPSMLLAAELSHRFSVVTVLANVVPMIENNAGLVGVREKLASVRYVNISVLHLGDRDALRNALLKEMVAAIEKDGAHALILGCTGMMGVARSLAEMLREREYDVPVIDPVGAAMQMLQAFMGMGITQSKRTYMRPPEKERT